MQKVKFNITRDSVIEKAVIECLTEMYAKSQPSADFNELRIQYSGTDTPFYQWYYLSTEEFHYILNKYIEAYGMKDSKKEYLELIIDNLKKGYFVDDYKPSWEDEYGYHPGYRDYKDETSLIEKIGKEAADKVFEILNERNNFYKTDREESSFSATIALGCSPTSNEQTVKEHWGDIEINPRHLNENTFYLEDFES